MLKQSKTFWEVCKQNKAVMIALWAILVLLGLADALKWLPIQPFQGIFVLLLCVCSVLLLLSRLRNQENQELIDNLRKAVLFAVLVEIIFCQWHSFHLFGGGGSYSPKTLDFTQAETVNFDPNTGKNLSSEEVSLTFRDLNIPIGTVCFKLNAPDSSIKDVQIDVTDDTNSAAFRSNVAVVRFISGNERSQHGVCNFSGKVHDIRFRYYPSENETITLSAIKLNEPINVHFSLLRMFFLFAVYFCLMMLTRSAWAGKTITENQRSVKICAYSITVVLMLTALFMANLGRYADEEHSLKKDFQSTSGNQITQEIVDAFEAGHTYLAAEPSEELLALENPYDRSQREGVNCPWDHLLYNGKIYSYYGIAPVLVLFLPYHMITGYYFPTVWAVFLFGCIGIFFMTKLYLYFMYQFFPKMHTSPVICGLVIMQLISGIWFCFFNPLFYEISQMSGFACIMPGAYFLLKAGVLGTEKKISLWRLSVSAICMSLGVLSRPTLAVYCVAAMPFLWLGLKKYLASGENKKIFTIRFLCASLLPYVFLGSLQMWYNAVRFGSPFDFGIEYSLTINDFTQAQYHSHFVLITLYNYLLAIPDFKTEFPFFDCSAVETFFPQGYYFVATYTAIGLFWKSLPLFSYTKGVNAYRVTENQNKRWYTILLVIVCLICPFAVMFSIWESGYGARYCVDFAWQMLIGALVIAFILFQKSEISLQKRLTRLTGYSTIFCFILVFGQTYSWIINSLALPLQSKAYSLARLFELWR